jgi:hypothetical protein
MILYDDDDDTQGIDSQKRYDKSIVPLREKSIAMYEWVQDSDPT